MRFSNMAFINIGYYLKMASGHYIENSSQEYKTPDLQELQEA